MAGLNSLLVTWGDSMSRMTNDRHRVTRGICHEPLHSPRGTLNVWHPDSGVGYRSWDMQHHRLRRRSMGARCKQRHALRKFLNQAECMFARVEPGTNPLFTLSRLTLSHPGTLSALSLLPPFHAHLLLLAATSACNFTHVRGAALACRNQH